jgi:hypothetical protein
MPALYAFVDTQIRVLEQHLRDYLSGELSDDAMAQASRSVIEAWNALPQDLRQGKPEAHEDVLWHAVWTTRNLADEEHGREGSSNPLLHECLHLLETRAELPRHYVARRP